MAFNYSLHHAGSPIFGSLPPAPELPAIGGASLAEDTASAEIVVDQPGVVIVNSDVKARLDLRTLANAASLNGDTARVILQADMPRAFSLTPGSYKLLWKTYA